MTNFANSLKRFRKKFKITQKQAADIANVSERNYQDYEYGKVIPSANAILALSDYFNVPIDYLLGNGLFAQMDDIIKNKEDIIFSIKPYFSPKTLKQFSSMDDIRFVWVISSFIDKIEIDKNDNSIKVIFKV